jgi:hypothetical protein
MPSPFPGMNPYLEHPHTWKDFHETFIPTARAILSALVRPKYFVSIEENLYIQDWTDNGHFAGSADVAVGRRTGSSGIVAGGAVLTAPMRGKLIVPEGERLSYLEVRNRDDEQLVTVIELLSPTNKRGRDRDRYLQKRAAILTANVHFVEIDLMRAGPRLPVEELPVCDYYVVVSRADERPEVGIWPLKLRDRLPSIPIPLRAPDPDAQLDLQEALDRAYDSAGYEDYIYRRDPDPPLSPEDAAWAQQFVPKVEPRA